MKPVILLSLLGFFISCGQNNDVDKLKRTVSRDSLVIANQITSVIAIGKVRPDSGITILSSPSDGIVTAKFITEGDTVQKHDLLVQLKDVEQRNKLAELSAQIQTQRERIQSDELELDQYNIRITDKEKTLTISLALAEEGAETTQNIQSVQTDIALLKAELTLAIQKIKIDKSQLQELQAQYAMAKNELVDRKLLSPGDGKVIDVEVEVGEVLQAYASYAHLIPMGHLVVWGEVDELFSNKIHTGQEVNIKYIGYPDTIARGQISYLSPMLRGKSLFSNEPGEMQDRLVRRFKVDLKGAPELLINAKVQCVIKLQNDVADSY